MGAIPAARDQWYVIHVLSGQEQKVRDNLIRRIQTEEMGDLVFEVLLPQERVSEVRKGLKRETKRKFFPGYLLVNMQMLTDNGALVDKSWYFIKDTVGVINFAGTRDKPTPMRPWTCQTQSGGYLDGMDLPPSDSEEDEDGEEEPAPPKPAPKPAAKAAPAKAAPAKGTVRPFVCDACTNQRTFLHARITCA